MMLDFSMIMKALSPENMAAGTDFIKKWTEAIQVLLDRTKHAESMAAVADSKLDTLVSGVEAANERLILLMAESNLTPEIHSDVLMMANADPRNQVDLSGVIYANQPAAPSS
jgi:hypothetical protein